LNYNLLENGALDHYGGPGRSCAPTGTPDNYLTDVLAARAKSFIERSAGHHPFAMEVATFAPHAPHTPAPRNACDFPGLRAPRDASFNQGNVDPPAWLGERPPLTSTQVGAIDTDFLKRARSAEAVDRLLGQLEAKLAATGQADNTYIVFRTSASR